MTFLRLALLHLAKAHLVIKDSSLEVYDLPIEAMGSHFTKTHSKLGYREAFKNRIMIISYCH